MLLQKELLRQNTGAAGLVRFGLLFYAVFVGKRFFYAVIILFHLYFYSAFRRDVDYPGNKLRRGTAESNSCQGTGAENAVPYSG